MKNIIFHTMKTIGKSTRSTGVIFQSWRFSKWTVLGTVPINMHRLKRGGLLSKSMMIGKALLSGLWACPVGCLAPSSCLTLAHVSLSVSPFFSPLSLRHGFVVVCFEVTICELLCLMACAMWSRGSWLGGSLVSAWCFCCFAHLLVWPCDFVFRLFCFCCHTLSR